MATGIGWIGQSNMFAIADWAQVVSPPSAPSLARLKYFNIDFYAALDNAGVFRACVMPASGIVPVTSGFDYPPNYPAPAINVSAGTFGPDIFGGIALADHLGTDVQQVKAAYGGLFLEVYPVGPVDHAMSWFWPSSHKSFDTQAPRSATPYTATVVDTGVASSIVTAGSPPFALLTDGTKSWVPGSLNGLWCVRGGSFGKIIANTATTATITYFFPNGYGAVPAAGAYSIEKRVATPASWLRTFIDGYCVGAKAADPTFDLKLVGVACGESDAMIESRAVQAKAAMLRLIWHVRNRAVANGVTSLQAHEIGFTLSLVKEIPEEPYAAIVNEGYRQIADADPHVRIVQVQDLPVGGLQVPGFPDPLHYNAAGQKTFGQRHGAAMIDLLSVSSTAVRASMNYPRKHRVVRPLWGVPASRPWKWEPDASNLPAYGSLVDMPAAYADVRGNESARVVTVDRNGYGITPRGAGSRWGYALKDRLQAMFSADNLQFVAPRRPAQLSGASTTPRASGYVWSAGNSAGSGFAEIQKTVGPHIIYQAQNLGGKVTRWSTGGIEWMQRGYTGAMGISAMLEIDEFTGEGDTLWMRHRIGDGDASRAQTQGRGYCKPPPAEAGLSVGMEYGNDELAPYAWAPAYALPALTADQIKLLHDHGGSSARGDAVLWDGVTLSMAITPDFLGISGCFRVVHSTETLHELGNSLDRLSMLQRVFVNPSVFDRPASYDPNTGTWLPWTTAGNLTRTFIGGSYQEITPTYTLAASGTGPFTKGAGVAAFEDVGGLVVGLYQSSSGGELLNKAKSITVSGTVTAANNPDYASYDQLTHAYLMQVCTQQSVVFRGTARWAMFLLVGDLATVQAAANALFQKGVDATWVD